MLPLFIAEMDYPLAPAISDALIAQVRASDVGYAADAGQVGSAFAGFAERRWGWRPDPADVWITTDVSVVIVEALRVAIAPGDPVIVTPPVYPPFFDLIDEAGGRRVDVPLCADDGWRLDLDGIEHALTAGARAVLLCHPHNPVGMAHSREDLERLADLAAAHDAVVVSDEIHAPLVHPGETFTPFLTVSDAARNVGIAAHSASKAFNIAGAKCALFVASSAPTRAMLRRLPDEVGYRTSILGRTATIAAFTDADDWLETTLTSITNNLDRLESLLAKHLPSVTMVRPRASYLVWLDMRALNLGDDPAVPILEQARVALHRGPAFGDAGKGFARINVACAPEVLDEAIRRIAELAR